MKAFFFIFCLLSSVWAISQEAANLLSYKRNNTIVVTFDLINTQPNQVYDLRLKFSDSLGRKFTPRTLSGDIRKVERGKNKQIVWDVLKDESKFPENLIPEIEVSRSYYVSDSEKDQIRESKKTKKNKKTVKHSSADHYSMNGLVLGANIGALFANNYTANYYNGSGNSGLNYILGPYSPPQIKADIKKVLNNYNYSYDSTSIPKNMKYDFAYSIGLHARYHFTSNSALGFELNFANLKTADVFMLEIDSVSSFDEKKFVECNIYGEESRYDFNVLWYQSFGKNKLFLPYFEAGVNMNNTVIKKNELKIRSLTYSISNPYNYMNNIKDDGIGFGIICGAGVLLNVSEKFAFDAGINISYKKIHLGNYQEYKPNTTFYLRVLLKSFGSVSSANPQEMAQ